MTTKSGFSLPLGMMLVLGLFIFVIGLGVNYTFIDEVYFADPAINFLTGHGYTTAVWNVTGQTETHVSSAPVYSVILIPWFKLFGATQTSIRSLSAALALASVLLFWRACLRSGWIHSGYAGGLLVFALLTDYGFAFSYTCGRPESFSALLITAMVYLSTLKSQRIGLGAISLIALLLPFVQWGCVIYLFFLSVALVFIFRKKALPFVVAVGAGMVVGLLVQKAVYTHWGIWGTWMDTIKSEGAETLIQRIGNRLSRDALSHHINTIPKDFSVMVMLAGMALLFGWSKVQQRQTGVNLMKFAWLIAATVTLGMYLVGKFPTYYGWMLSFPLAAILAAYFDQSCTQSRREAGLAAIIALLAGGIGLPLQAGLAIHDWNDRNPAGVTAWLDPKISKDDVVYCDYPFYFIAKTRAKQVFTGRYIQKMTPAEFASITLAILDKEASLWLPAEHPLTNAYAIGIWKPAHAGILGNNWEYGMLSGANYSCTVYRLKGPAK